MTSLDNLSIHKLPIIRESSIFDNGITYSSLNTQLCYLLQTNLNDPFYQLTSEQINWLNTFINSSPDIFSKFSFQLQSLTSSGIINIYNIPQIIKIFVDIYNSEIKPSNLEDSSNILVLIKYTFDVLIRLQILIIPCIENEFINEVINNSLLLLNMKLNLGENIDLEINKKKSNKCFISFLHLFLFK